MDEPELFDIAIIGGGINGCGIARDAAGRGASVILFEMGDLAEATSSASTKLIHGGLRYLEHFAFRLVREALKERDVLRKIAPHLIEPLRFVLPHHEGLRPAWLIRAGLFLYDRLGKDASLPRTRALDLGQDESGAPLKSSYRRGFEYSDCRVDDSRLVVLNAKDASGRGARILTRCKVTAAAREPACWSLSVQDAGGHSFQVKARSLVNAAGPWAGDVLKLARVPNAPSIRLVQGSHIVVKRLFSHGRAYIFQNPDGRVVFAIPFQEDYTLIGTTDRDYKGSCTAVKADQEEIRYLCEAVSVYFKRPVAPEDVVWSYSGVRALLDDHSGRPQDTSRDYLLHLDAKGAPILSVIGGKITTYRRLAEAALDRLKAYCPALQKSPWTSQAPLPGGGMPQDGLPSLIASLKARYPFLSEGHAARLARAYGTRSVTLLGDASQMADLGPRFGADLTAREVSWLMREEWARSAEDILWRRSKLGLRFTNDERETLAAFMTKEETAAHGLEALHPRA